MLYLEDEKLVARLLEAFRIPAVAMYWLLIGPIAGNLDRAARWLIEWIKCHTITVPLRAPKNRIERAKQACVSLTAANTIDGSASHGLGSMSVNAKGS